MDKVGKIGSQRGWLVEARKAAGLTVNELAAKVQISAELMHMLEKYDDVITHPRIANRIYSVLEIPWDRRNSMVAVKHRTDRPVARRKIRREEAVT